jgi:hypothetical protein
MKTKLNFKPVGILKTMSAKFFEEYPGGEEEFRRSFELMDSDDKQTWHLLIGAIPKIDVEFCYVTFGGKIQYRATILQYRKVSGGKVVFTDGGKERHLRARYLIQLCGPVIKAPTDMPKKGFQGFRYTDFIF